MPTQLNLLLQNDDTSPVLLKDTAGNQLPGTNTSVSGTCINGVSDSSDLINPLGSPGAPAAARCDLTKPIVFRIKLTTDYAVEQFKPNGTVPAGYPVCFYQLQTPNQCLTVTNLQYLNPRKLFKIKGEVNLTDHSNPPQLLADLHYRVNFQAGASPTTLNNFVFDPEVKNKPGTQMSSHFMIVIDNFIQEFPLVAALIGVLLGVAFIYSATVAVRKVVSWFTGGP